MSSNSITNQQRRDKYIRQLIEGGLIYSLTSLSVVRFDVIKCNMQVHPQFPKGIKDGLKKIIRERKIALGMLPTFIGSFITGSRFMFFQIFKDVYRNILKQSSHIAIWLSAGISAQAVASALACPWEAIKIKMQVSQESSYPRMTKMIRQIMYEQGFGSLYKGYIPIFLRQIIFAYLKFTTYSSFRQMFYFNIFTKNRQSYSEELRTGIAFASGFLSGGCCSFLTHPLDTMVSNIYCQKNRTDSIKQTASQIYNKIGFKGLWSGLWTRIFMCGILTGTQFYLFRKLDKSRRNTKW